eukprot:CAMPEP_0197032520 /NCGR_PEP_ID=MMETSP1384-20130603/11185_1 /TAXON_ID=29189 /ORGANISM="Ammonia sp." /LENGTH=638 /DNA_ID=CAMNT_0042462201 /DNA_START=81 /DNA_END=1997 /DNA_ORIENTATION=-
MALQAIDSLVTTFGEWSDIIGNRTAADMAKETAFKYSKNKKNSNAYQRLVYLQKLFNGGKSAASSSSAEEKKHDHEHEHEHEHGAGCTHDHHHDHEHVSELEQQFYKPVDNPLKLGNAESSPIKDTTGMYAISSKFDCGVDCNFAFQGSGKYYYEVELIEDPSTYKEINIGFANSSHSGRAEVGMDANSYGYNGVSNKLYHMDTSYGSTRWKAGDVLGFALDLTVGNEKFECFLNGASQGVVFEKTELDYHGDALFAGFTLQGEQNGVLIYSESKLKHTKPAGYSCLNLSADAKEEDVWTKYGDIKLESEEEGMMKITANSGFPTAMLSGQALAKNGKYYFEFVLGSAGCMQLGFGDDEFKPDASQGEGIGDDAHSWGVDLLRMRKWGVWAKPYCNANWSKGDVVGCCLDIDDKRISYSLNGKDLGVAFEDVEVSADGGLFPSVSVRNAAAREEYIRVYRAKRGEEEGHESMEFPPSITYFNLVFADQAYRYKPAGYLAVSEHAVFKASEICDSLAEYSYKQYVADYEYMDSVIMLSRDEEFDEICKQLDAETLVVCDFWATWCGPCVYIAPYYHEMSEKYKDVVFLKADVDELSKLSQEKGINCMPTFKFFKNGKEIHKIEGADKDAIVDAIEKFSK